MPGHLLSRPLVEIAADLRARRVTARELVEATIGRHERLGERLHAYSFWAPEQARLSYEEGHTCVRIGRCRARQRPCHQQRVSLAVALARGLDGLGVVVAVADEAQAAVTTIQPRKPEFQRRSGEGC
jgi:Asp-tRNA(Asn)/Glu-tRNA(Gln) amidotransferase A subunit family amidase